MNNNSPTQCTCPENARSLSELCESCLAEYDRWLAEESAATAQEVREMGSEQLLSAAAELFELAEELSLHQLTCRVRKLNAALWSAGVY